MKIQNRDGTVTAEVEPGLEALRVMPINKRGIGYSCFGATTTAYAPAANTAVWVLRNSSSGAETSNAPIILVDRIRLMITAVAGAVGAQVNQRLGLYRGAATVTAPTLSGGAAILAVPRHSLRRPGLGVTTVNTLRQFGEIRIGTTATLTHANVTYDAMPIREANFAWMTAAGSFYDVMWEFSETENQQLSVGPGQFLAIRAPVAFPAVSFLFGVNCDYREVNNYPLATT